MVSMRHLVAISKQLCLLAPISAFLSACAGLTALPFGEGMPQYSSTAIKSMELDPLEASLSDGELIDDPMAVEPSQAESLGGEGSRRVPLGSLAAGSPTSLVQPGQSTEIASSEIKMCWVNCNRLFAGLISVLTKVFSTG